MPALHEMPFNSYQGATGGSGRCAGRQWTSGTHQLDRAHAHQQASSPFFKTHSTCPEPPLTCHSSCAKVSSRACSLSARCLWPHTSPCRTAAAGLEGNSTTRFEPPLVSGCGGTDDCRHLSQAGTAPMSHTCQTRLQTYHALPNLATFPHTATNAAGTSPAAAAPLPPYQKPPAAWRTARTGGSAAPCPVRPQ